MKSFSLIYFSVALMLVFSSCEDGHHAILTPSDFDFDGEIGSAGAEIQQIDSTTFRITLDHAPGHPTWPNKLNFHIRQNAQGKRLTIIVEGPPDYSFNEYFQSWSYDMENWHPIQWEAGYQVSPERDTLRFPQFEQDEVWVGTQVPMTYEQVESMLGEALQSRYVTMDTLGQSLGGRNLYRVRITDPDSDIPESQRWVHYFANQHPGEHNSQWRMVGMVEWLLSEAAAEFRRRSICHFVPMMSPDGPHNGWYRVNAEGVDMNRSYRPQGSDSSQAHEAFIYQRDLEKLMQSESPVTTIWSMHTWQGPVEPLIRPGPEFGTQLGSWQDFRDIIEQHDTSDLIEPLKTRQGTPGYGPVSWSSGPNKQFGITSILCEGAGNIYTKAENKESGRVLMRSIADFYTAPYN